MRHLSAVPDPTPGPTSDEAAAVPVAGPGEGSAGALERDEFPRLWHDAIVGRLSNRARSLYGAAQIARVDPASVVVEVDNGPTLARCEALRREVEAAIAAQVGFEVTVLLVVRGDVPPPPPEPEDESISAVDDEESIDLDELVDAGDIGLDELSLLKAAFPGAEEVDPPEYS